MEKIIPKCAIILAGGKGTRLGNLTVATPKPLLHVGGEPFIFHVINNLIRYGISDIVLSVGHMADSFFSCFRQNSIHCASVRIVKENEPLGTGGGVRLASQGMNEPFFVINGDTFFDCSFGCLSEILERNSAHGGLFLRECSDMSRYGAISLVGDKVLAFHEKSHSGSGLINGGVYLLTPDATAMIPAGQSSLECELFPTLAAAGKLVGAVSSGFFLDIGLPETYSLAQTLLPEWERNMQCTTVHDYFLRKSP